MSSKLILTDQLYDYMLQHSLRQHPVEAKIRKRTEELDTAEMISTPESSQFLSVLVHLMQARRIIEVGIYTGVTTLALALALPDDGTILACDKKEEWVDIARSHWKEAGIDHKIDLQMGYATETLQARIDAGEAGTYDFAFVDANKTDYPLYYELCLTLLRPGGLLLFDNALWSGTVSDPTNEDKTVQIIRLILDKMHKDDRMHTCLIPVADGMALGVKK